MKDIANALTSPATEIGFAKVREGRPKDLKAAQVSTVIMGCGREHKFTEDDPQRECHLGLKTLDLEKCQWCVWFNSQTGKRSRLLTGGQAVALTGMLKTLRQSGEVELNEDK